MILQKFGRYFARNPIAFVYDSSHLPHNTPSIAVPYSLPDFDPTITHTNLNTAITAIMGEKTIGEIRQDDKETIKRPISSSR